MDRSASAYGRRKIFKLGIAGQGPRADSEKVGRQWLATFAKTPPFLIWLALHRQQAVPSMRHSIQKGIIIQGLLGDDICQAFQMVFDGAGLTVGLINMGLIHRAGHTSIPSMIFTIKSSPICLYFKKCVRDLATN